jgi:class 3 adenylate cyclase
MRPPSARRAIYVQGGPRQDEQMSITEFLSDTAGRAESDLRTAVTIEEASTFPTPSKLYLEKPVWKRIEDTVVVATDLKGSTRISYTKQDRVGARVYQASTGNCSRILERFTPQFVDVQGDGLFAIFHGDLAAERAVAAAFTLKSFSSSALARVIDEQLGTELPEGFETGLKIGVDAGTLLAKRVGVRGEHNEPVWAGKPVNYATKCAQAAERHELIVTDRFFKLVGDNDYVRYSCGCAGGEVANDPSPLWRETDVETLGDHSSCKTFPQASSWCVRHGDAFCAAIETGKSHREEIDGLDLPELVDISPDALAA